MTEAIEAAKRIASTRDPNAFDELYGLGPDDGDYNYCDDAELVATELLRLAEPEWGEPVDDGPVWVEGEDGVWACRRNRDDGKWWVAYCIGTDGMKSIKANWEPLNGRRVAPCVGRPRKAGG